MDKRKLIIDCDPGHDDAIMLLLAISRKEFDILGVTTESGNQSIEKTTQNAINVCEYLGADLKFYKGPAHPIIKEVQLCPEIHGETGLDGFIFPKYNKKVEDENAISFMIRTLLENDKVTVVTTGPATNLALALRVEPKIKEHIDEIVMMGGSTDNGNITPAAEFNTLCDPEAFDIIFKSGLKVKMVGLNITRQVLVTNEIIERMEKINNKASVLFSDLMKVYNQNQFKTFGIEAGPLHDPVTLVSLINPDVVKYDLMDVTVDLSHGESYGRTNCDTFHYKTKGGNIYVAMGIDVNKYWDTIEEAIKTF